jgi:hypothetical protein
MNEVFSVLATLAGWCGGLCTAGAYALATRRRIEPGSARFQAMNAVGGALLAVSAAASGAWPSAAVNFVWMFFGVQALVSARQVVLHAVRRRVRFRGSQA